MIFLKSLIFIVWNMAIGASLVLIVNWFLFNRQRRLFGMRSVLTPGFIVRKREWIFNKVRDLLHDYLEQAEDKLNKHGYLAKWEAMVRNAVWEKTSFIEGWKLLPHSIKQKIHNAITDAVRDVVSKILRRTIPKFIEQWRVEYRIDEFDEKFSIEFIYGYWKRYALKPALYFMLALNFLIGITNMILYWIIA